MNEGSVHERNEMFEVWPIGYVRRKQGRTYLEILAPYAPALKELEKFSHVQVLWWFSLFQDKEYRSITQSQHAPYKAPVLGMFACRSPVRPNPIGLTTAKILDVDLETGVVEIASIDAYDETPVLDLKAYLPSCDRVRDVEVGHWATEWGEWMPVEGLELEDD